MSFNIKRIIKVNNKIPFTDYYKIGSLDTTGTTGSTCPTGGTGSTCPTGGTGTSTSYLYPKYRSN